MRSSPAALLFLLGIPLLAQDPIDEFSLRIAALYGLTEPVAVEVESREDHPAPFVSEFRRALVERLASAGVRTDAASAARLKITLSANAEGPLWIAEALAGDWREVVLYAPPPGWSPAAAAASPELALEAEFVWRQSAPLLDLAVDAGRMIVLEPRRVAFYERSGGAWAERAEVDLPADTAICRDPRGRLQTFSGGFHAHLPGGLHCTGASGDEPAVHCTREQFHWPVAGGRASMPAGRNYFEGAVAGPGDGVRQWPPFYAAASWESDQGRDWLVAETGGQTRLYSNAGRRLAEFPELGSDFAPLSAHCAQGRYLAAAGRGEASLNVFLYEIGDGEAALASEPAALPGGVTALWPGGDGESALAVAHDAETGEYAAFRLSIRCPR